MNVYKPLNPRSKYLEQYHHVLCGCVPSVISLQKLHRLHYAGLPVKHRHGHQPEITRLSYSSYRMRNSSRNYPHDHSAEYPQDHYLHWFSGGGKCYQWKNKISKKNINLVEYIKWLLTQVRESRLEYCKIINRDADAVAKTVQT